MNRIFGIVITLTWLVAMAALVRRDIVPYWFAEDAPRSWAAAQEVQCGIFNDAGRRIGTSWSVITPGPQLVTTRGLTLIDLSALEGYLPIRGRLLLKTLLTYEADGPLVEFEFSLRGAGFPIEIAGERLGSDYACTAVIGGTRTVVPLDWRLSEGLGELARPFSHLDGLYVGRRWRLRLLDPFAVVTGGSLEFKTQLATVTKMENVDVRGAELECFRVETEGSTAWVDRDGRIVRQEARIPLLGRWTLLNEPFDREEMRVTAAGYESGGDEARRDYQGTQYLEPIED